MRRIIALCVLIALPASAQTIRNVTQNADERVLATATTLDDAGSLAYTLTDTDDHGINPRRAFQIESFDTAAGTATGISGFLDGALDVQVSDDGMWLAFLSAGNLTGSNHDESAELYVMKTDGTQLQQLTDDDDLLAPDVGPFAFAGSGNRIAFWDAAAGGMYVIDRDGTNLALVTTLAAPAAISDDGTRILFLSNANPFGTNADGTRELFGILNDGTGLTQLTSLAADANDAVLSGDGTRAAFASTDDPFGSNTSNWQVVFTVLWNGSGLAQLSPGSGWAASPAIVDDGGTILFASTIDEGQNAEGNTEIWSVLSDGSGLAALTQTGAAFVNTLPSVAGGGSRIAFLSSGGEFSGGNNPDNGPELMAMDSAGNSIVQLTDLAADPDSAGGSGLTVTPDGSKIVYFTDGSPITVVNADGSGSPLAITPPADYVTSVSASDTTVVFNSQSDLTGENPANNLEVFAVDLDGGDLRQLYVSAVGVNEHPVIAADDSWVVFQSADVLLGGLMRIRPDGSDSGTVVSDFDGLYKWPQISGDGDWVVYQSQAGGPTQVYRIRIDGTQQLTLAAGDNPHVSGDGSLVVYTGSDGECYLWDASGPSTGALTTSGSCDGARVSGDGTAVGLLEAPEMFDGVDPGLPRPYRYDVALGTTERAGGVARRSANSEFGPGYRNRFDGLAMANSGSLLVYQGAGDWDGANPTGRSDTYVVDRDGSARITVEAAAPTVVRWDADARFRRYDLIRGDVAQLQENGGVVDLGNVVCVEDDSPDVDNAGDEDAAQPLPGQVFFFLFRGTQGVADGPGSYGTGSSGLERTASSGDCSG